MDKKAHLKWIADISRADDESLREKREERDLINQGKIQGMVKIIWSEITEDRNPSQDTLENLWLFITADLSRNEEIFALLGRITNPDPKSRRDAHDEAYDELIKILTKKIKDSNIYKNKMINKPENTRQ